MVRASRRSVWSACSRFPPTAAGPTLGSPGRTSGLSRSRATAGASRRASVSWHDSRSCGAVFVPIDRPATARSTSWATRPVRATIGIYRAELVNGEYAKPELLPRSINLPAVPELGAVHRPRRELPAVLLEPREADLDARRSLHQPPPGGRQLDRTGQPGRAGQLARGRSVFPGLSPDGKYLFFARDTPGRDNDVYWVSAASIPALRSGRSCAGESAIER